jgi:hypothetical protein
MESISLRGHIPADGILELRVPAKLSGTDLEITILVRPVTAAEAEVDEKGWPKGYFERTFGSLKDNSIEYELPPDFEERAELD